MRVFILVVVFSLLAISSVLAFGLGGMGRQFGKMGAVSGFGHATPPLSGKLLLESGGSFLLLEDGASKLCFQGGC
jgi:hypothetical protein